MSDHRAGSSAIARLYTRVLIAIEQKFGLDPKKSKVLLLVIVAVTLLIVSYISSTYLNGIGDIDGVNGGDSAMMSSSSSSTQLSDNSEAASASNLFADDGGGGGDDEDGEDGGGGGGGDDEEKGEAAEEDDGSSADDAEVEALKPKQLKLFQDKDKTLMKFFTKHRKDSEIASHFQMLEDMYKELKIMKTIPIGSTYEKKSLLAYSIGKGKSGRGILVFANERADEWAGNMALAYFATRLLQKYALTPAVTKVVNSLTIYLVPVANPDGLSYVLSSSSKSHREWFMNRALNAEKKHGVDVSKDFEAFTQLETQALKAFSKKNSENIHAFVSIRCCGGAVSIPKAALCMDKPEEQKSVATRVAQAMSKLGTYKYQARFTDADESTSPVFAFKELNTALSFVLDAHPSGSASSPADMKSSDILAASQNVTMGLLEIAKYVALDFNKASIGLGGGSSKPCGTGAGAGKKKKQAAAADDAEDEGDEEGSSRGGDEDEEGGGGSGGEDEEEESSGSKKKRSAEDDEDSDKSSSSSSADEGNEHADAFNQAKQGSAAESTDELETALKHVLYEGVKKPVAGVEVPPDQEGETFLYFAYGPDMLYDVLIKAGLTSAWKVVNAKLPGYTYDYTYHSNKKWRSGVADIVKYSHSTVYGVVWRLDKLHMQTLLTWQSASTPASPLAPKTVTVEDLEGNSYNCLTFYVVKKMKGEDILGKYHRFNPSRQYRNCVLKGAKANHLPFDYVEHKLKSRSLGPLFTDKVGTTGHRNVLIGNVCDPLDY